MTDRRPWNRLRSALHRETQTEAVPLPLAGVTLEGFRAWAYDEGLTLEEPVADVVTAEGGHRLGSVLAQCVVGASAGTVLGVEVAVTASRPAAPPDLAALLLKPVAPALGDAQRAALDTWLRGVLARGGPYNAVSTLGGVQVAISIDDADPRGRTWALSARPEPGPSQPS